MARFPRVEVKDAHGRATARNPFDGEPRVKKKVAPKSGVYRHRSETRSVPRLTSLDAPFSPPKNSRFLGQRGFRAWRRSTERNPPMRDVEPRKHLRRRAA